MQRSLIRKREEHVLKLLLPLLILLYRVTGGRIAGSMNGTAVLLLTTTGRRSGKQRTVPVSYIKNTSSYVIAATNGGPDSPPPCVLHLPPHPHVNLHVKH